MKKGADIADRLLDLGLESLKVARRLPRHTGSRHVALQLIRCATGAGANYEEARAAESAADFAHKLGVAAKEAREACYWLTLIQRSAWLRLDIGTLVEEADHLAAILGASKRTAQKNLGA